MPKSKRAQLVTLAQTSKHGKSHKADIIQNIREALTKYSHCYVLSYENMRNAFLKEVRDHLEGRMFVGKNKVMMVALGRTETDEQEPDLFKVSQQLTGDTALFFTDMPKEDVVSYFQNYHREDFAKAGVVATRTIRLPAGPLVIPDLTIPEPTEPAEGEEKKAATTPSVVTGSSLPTTMEPLLRRLGLPTLLKNGVIELMGDYPLCHIGDPLTSDQCKILKHFNIKMSDTRMKLKCVWAREGGFQAL
nr:mRNA turnover protein 4 [Paratrimastix eleionoma]